MEAMVALWEYRKERNGSGEGGKTGVSVSRRKRENYALVPCTSLRIHVAKRESARSFDPDDPHPAVENKILHKSRYFPDRFAFRDFVFESPERQARLPRSRVFMKRERGVHARVYTCSKFVPFGAFTKEWYEEWSNYATYCRTAGTTFSRPHARAPGKAFPIDDGRIVSTIEPLFVLHFFFFSLNKKNWPDISIIIRFERGTVFSRFTISGYDNNAFKWKTLMNGDNEDGMWK